MPLEFMGRFHEILILFSPRLGMGCSPILGVSLSPAYVPLPSPLMVTTSLRSEGAVHPSGSLFVMPWISCVDTAPVLSPPPSFVTLALLVILSFYQYSVGHHLSKNSM